MTEPKACPTPGACSCPPIRADVATKIEAEIERTKSVIPIWHPNMYSRDRAIKLNAQIETLRWVLSLANQKEPTDD